VVSPKSKLHSLQVNKPIKDISSEMLKVQSESVMSSNSWNQKDKQEDSDDYVVNINVDKMICLYLIFINLSIY
jgi:hypothetical protein